MVVQLGLAMIPRWPPAAASLTPATTSGTCGSMRHAEELSTTTAPAAAKRGACSRARAPPAEKRATSMPAGSAAARSSTSTSPQGVATRVPADRAEAISRISPTGKERRSRVAIISRPTAPVAPTTATLRRLMRPPLRTGGTGRGAAGGPPRPGGRPAPGRTPAAGPRPSARTSMPSRSRRAATSAAACERDDSAAPTTDTWPTSSSRVTAAGPPPAARAATAAAACSWGTAAPAPAGPSPMVSDGDPGRLQRRRHHRRYRSRRPGRPGPGPGRGPLPPGRPGRRPPRAPRCPRRRGRRSARAGAPPTCWPISTERSIRTPAPAAAISAISANDTSSSLRASGTTRGSAVNTPSTSV